MKTLLQIQNEVASEWFAKNSPISQEKFRIFDFLHTYTQHELWPEVCRRAQLECARETLKEAAKNGKVKWVESESYNMYRIVDKSSITDEANIKLIQ